MSRFLVTGGCGFIGQRLIERLLAEGAQSVRVVDNLTAGHPDNLRALGEVQETKHVPEGVPRTKIQLIEGDIRDEALAVSASRDVDAIVHLAANTGVAPSLADPRLDCVTNVIGTFNYLEAARANGVARFVFASSGAVIGECEPPIHELLPGRPVSPYGASKLAGEAYCSAYANSFGLQTAALRFGNVYGPGSEHKESVVAKFIRRGLSGQTLEVYGDGNQTRDFIYIDDLVRAIQLALTTNGIAGESFQIASARETTLNELIEHLCDAFEHEGLPRPKVQFAEQRKGDVRRNFADTTKAKQRLGWTPGVDLGAGLRMTLRWMIARRAGQLAATVQQ